MLDILNADGWGLGPGGQARTSTIWPWKISKAFWISGSFLKSSLLKGTEASFSFGDEAVAAAGLGAVGSGASFAIGAAAAGADCVAPGTRPGGDSAFANLTCAF